MGEPRDAPPLSGRPSPALVFHQLTQLPATGPPLATLRVPCQQPGRREQVRRPASCRSFGPATPEVDAAVRAVADVVLSRDRDGRKAYPSAGGLYAVRGYVVQSYARLVTAPGGSHQPVLGAVDPEEIRTATFGQVAGQPNWLVLTGSQPDYQERYGLRGYRYLLLEAGHVAQCLIDEAGHAGLRALPVGAFDDEGLAAAVGLRGTRQLPLYVVAMGAEAARG
ncbi:nitroreductase family protein [Micromonospora sagamiensis]|uniref:Nitroreductase family protein n=1 Tax=Micromonospora sagamiensis TaxID=47875 RepID=A0A562WQ03_9ACTN|nr:nitroreductase family protein [Micromonospora sagamiensis]TWJ32211.1 nitroreductase family protein [Micromonospora sagamiensis]BCL14731.1 glucose-1-phosphate adenylyltransferase [Micromonospora sagamiensis]